MFTDLEKKLVDSALGAAVQSCHRSEAKSAMSEVKEAYAKQAILLTDLRVKIAKMETVKDAQGKATARS